VAIWICQGIPEASRIAITVSIVRDRIYTVQSKEWEQLSRVFERKFWVSPGRAEYYEDNNEMGQ
jgi:hypothetical protein